MPDKKIRIPLSPEQHETLAKLLQEVPVRKIIQYEWGSEAGRAFVKELRRIQLTGVPVPWIADALDVTKPALGGAIGYWERAPASRGSSKVRRARRPLRKATGGDEST